MCGIVGYVGQQEAVPILLDGLQKLEYRGYDSAGLAVISRGRLELRRCQGKLKHLVELVARSPLKSVVGLGHTRWATHGRPSEENAHPHTNTDGTLAVVHNGIIENDRALHQELEKAGYKFASDTDSEVFAHLIDKYYRPGTPLETAVRRAVARVKGTFALGVVSQREPQKIVAARRGSPLIVGLGNKEFFIASDVPALLPHTREVLYVADNELVVITPAGVKLTNAEGRAVVRKPDHITWDALQAEKGGYKHFMLKEIFEQPQVIEDTLRGRVSGLGGEVILDSAHLTAAEVKNFRRIFLVACGTSWHAALVGKFLIESLAGIPTEVDFASEFRYRSPLVDRQSLVVLISQSGETADTLAALQEAKKRQAQTLTICNVLGSSMTREAHGTLYTHAGPEIGVASTKAFTAQLAALHLLALFLGRKSGNLSAAKATVHMDRLRGVPRLMEKVLKTDAHIQELSALLFKNKDFLYLGRGINYPIALEGALKLKEISYIHAEGYPAGEMKHGPIALIDGRMPVVTLATNSSVLEKVISNIQEVKTRDGSVLALVTRGNREVPKKADWVIEMPPMEESISPLLNVIPLQLLAYHVAVKRGCDVDQPRNLAKSVTVE
ncbi:MAG: glutamine--fructose-6-phosphate transaminase (isomerizing) [Candidatus Firestonebacteria bacterium]|nr:glutamine--fructose-6-phosphate transaminase (isomerizing) [Candidatus Firestonebacteria bacterium]